MGYNLILFITRNANGKIVLPDQKLDRVTVLKMWTTWAPGDMLKEGQIGSLETGKLADFGVLDQDYFTIPVDDIPKIKPQMTVMDAKVRYLGRPWARTRNEQIRTFARRQLCEKLWRQILPLWQFGWPVALL